MRSKDKDWEKISVNQLSDKVLIPRIRKEILKLKNKIRNGPIF